MVSPQTIGCQQPRSSWSPSLSFIPSVFVGLAVATTWTDAKRTQSPRKKRSRYDYSALYIGPVEHLRAHLSRSGVSQAIVQVRLLFKLSVFVSLQNVWVWLKRRRRPGMTNENPSKGSTMQSLFEELGEWEEVKAMADKKTTPITTVDILASRPSLLSRIKGYLIGKLDWFDHVIL
jgi:hypothetical protein